MKPEFRKRASRSDHWFSDGRFGIGLMVGIVVCLFAWLFSDLLGSGLKIGDAKDLVPSIATAVVALVSVIVAGVALQEQRIMRQAGTDPVLVAHLSQEPDEPIIILLSVSNVGAGAAMNVFVTAQRPPYAEASRFIGRPFDTPVLTGKQPITVILQNERVTYNLGTGPMLLSDGGIGPFSVDLNYQDIEGSEYSSTHTIDVTELTGRPVRSPPSKTLLRQLEKIEKTLRGKD
jgi:hypothetical protein